MQKDEDFSSSFSRMVLRYTRRGLLNQKDHGLNLSASIEKRYLPEAQAREASNTYGLNRLNLSASHQLTETLGLGLSAYFALSDLRDSSNESTARNYIYFILSQNLDLGNSYGLSISEEIFKNNNKLDSGEYNELTLTLELSKQITEKFGTSFAISGSPISGKDSWDYDSSFIDNLGYSLALSYSAF